MCIFSAKQMSRGRSEERAMKTCTYVAVIAMSFCSSSVAAYAIATHELVTVNKERKEMTWAGCLKLLKSSKSHPPSGFSVSESYFDNPSKYGSVEFVNRKGTLLIQMACFGNVYERIDSKIVPLN